MTKRKPLSEFLDRALDRPGASRAAIARALGVSRSTVQKWSSGQRAIPERFRASLRNAARGAKVTPPAAPSGGVRTSPANVTVTPLSGGGQHTETHSRKSFADEFSRHLAAGTAPDSFSVMLHGFRSVDSPDVKARPRRLVVSGLTDAEKAAIASGSKDALDEVITRAIHATNYTGGFTFRRGTRWNFDT